jgi:hypothetical protein
VVFESLCPAACTETFGGDLNVFSSVPHMHKLGKEMWVSQSVFISSYWCEILHEGNMYPKSRYSHGVYYYYFGYFGDIQAASMSPTQISYPYLYRLRVEDWNGDRNRFGTFVVGDGDVRFFTLSPLLGNLNRRE